MNAGVAQGFILGLYLSMLPANDLPGIVLFGINYLC